MQHRYTGRRIAVEEGYRTKAFAEFAKSFIDPAGPEPAWIARSARQVYKPGDNERRAAVIADLGEGRIAAMDAVGLDLQLLVQAFPGTQALPPDIAVEFTRNMNAELADAISLAPTRLAGLASLPTQHPEKAAEELERAVTKFGMKGAVIHSFTRGTDWPNSGIYLDDPSMSPVFESAVSLDAPIYLHPTIPSPQMAQPYTDYGLIGPMWGYSAEASIHILRLILSGIFDRFPSLTLVVGHLGEGIPYYFERLDEWYEFSDKTVKLQQRPSEYFRTHIFVSTSGMNRSASRDFCYQVLGPKRMMFAADYPQEPLGEEVSSMDQWDIPEHEKRQIYFENAEAVFGL